MRVLGVHATSSTLWLACADADGPVDLGKDYKVTLPTALESGAALERARDAIARLIRTHEIDRVWLLSAEYSKRFKYTYNELVDRITMETVVAFAAASRDIEFRRVARKTARNVLGIPDENKMSAHASKVVTRQDPHWGPDKRDLAAMTALAGLKEGGRDV